MSEGPELHWRPACLVGSCVSCRRQDRADGRVLVISPRHNGGFEMRMCRECLAEASAMLARGDNTEFAK